MARLHPQLQDDQVFLVVVDVALVVLLSFSLADSRSKTFYISVTFGEERLMIHLTCRSQRTINPTTLKLPKPKPKLVSFSWLKFRGVKSCNWFDWIRSLL